MIFEVFKFTLKETIEYEKVILQFKAIGIEPSVDEVVQLANSTGLSLARAANRIYWQYVMEVDGGVEKREGC